MRRPLAEPALLNDSLVRAPGYLAAPCMCRTPWIAPQARIWGFTFGLSALAGAPVRLIERGETGPLALLAPYLFISVNVIIVAMALATLNLLARGKLLPPAAAPVQPVSSAS